jgi:hypothetical protein
VDFASILDTAACQHNPDLLLCHNAPFQLTSDDLRLTIESG